MAKRTLLRDGQPLMLTPKAFDLLLALVERGGHIVEKEELMSAVWFETVVEESNLTHHISVLRKVLGENAGGRLFIETIPRRGYRFIPEVRTRTTDEDAGRRAVQEAERQPDQETFVHTHTSTPRRR